MNTECFTDERDGQTYRTVEIGGVVWLAQNLDYKVARYSWVYMNGRHPTGIDYGRLYTWRAAQEAVPDGWRLPTPKDYFALAESLNLTVNTMHTKGFKDAWTLQAPGGWTHGHATNESGFSALPGGIRHYNNRPLFTGRGERARWWMSEEIGRDSAEAIELTAGGWTDITYQRKSDGYSVRCIKNEKEALNNE